jgi:hypothetical protein
MIGRNVPFESEGKGYHIRRCYQPKLGADHKERSVLKHYLSVATDETMKQ